VASQPWRKPPHDDVLSDGRRRAQARLIWQEALNSVMGKAVVNSTVQAIPLSVMLPRARQTDWCLTRKRTPIWPAANAALQVGHKGATDRIFHLRRAAVHEGTPIHRTRDASRDIKPRCQDHHPAAIGPQPPPSDPRPIGRAARLLLRPRRRSRRWLPDTDGPPIGAVDRNSGLTRCRHWRICWTSFRSGGTICHPASQTARRQKRSVYRVDDRRVLADPVGVIQVRCSRRHWPGLVPAIRPNILVK
jgi:hypothetical protein